MTKTWWTHVLINFTTCLYPVDKGHLKANFLQNNCNNSKKKTLQNEIETCELE